MKQHTLLTHLPNLPIPINYTFLLLTFPPNTIYWLNSSSRAGSSYLYVDCCSLLKSVGFWKDNQFVIECIETLHFSVLFWFFSNVWWLYFLYLLYGRKIDKSDLVLWACPMRQLTVSSVCVRIQGLTGLFSFPWELAGKQVYLSSVRKECSIVGT